MDKREHQRNRLEVKILRILDCLGSQEGPRSGHTSWPCDSINLGLGAAKQASWGAGAALLGERAGHGSLQGPFPDRAVYAGLEEAVSWGQSRPVSHANLQKQAGISLKQAHDSFGCRGVNFQNKAEPIST